MGKKSRERATGKSQEERQKNPRNLNNRTDAIKEQKRANKDARFFRKLQGVFPEQLIGPLQNYVARKAGVKKEEEKKP